LILVGFGILVQIHPMYHANERTRVGLYTNYNIKLPRGDASLFRVFGTQRAWAPLELRTSSSLSSRSESSTPVTPQKKSCLTPDFSRVGPGNQRTAPARSAAGRPLIDP
jgi:hypothetical protein